MGAGAGGPTIPGSRSEFTQGLLGVAQDSQMSSEGLGQRIPQGEVAEVRLQMPARDPRGTLYVTFRGVRLPHAGEEHEGEQEGGVGRFMICSHSQPTTVLGG